MLQYESAIWETFWNVLRLRNQIEKITIPFELRTNLSNQIAMSGNKWKRNFLK